jgi:hypothetical protein
MNLRAKHVSAGAYQASFMRLRDWLCEKYLSYIPKSYLLYIPGTKQFRSRYQRQIANEARRGLKLFTNLHTLDYTTKQRLFYQIRSHENRKAIMVIGRRYTGTIVLVLYLFAILAIYTYYTLPSLDMPTRQNIYQYLFIGVFCAVTGIFRRQFAPRIYPSIIVLWIILYWILRIPSIDSRLKSEYPFFLEYLWWIQNVSLISGIFVTIVAVLLFVIILVLWCLFDRRLKTNHPDTVLINVLLRVLSIVEKQPHHWADLKFRRQLIPMIEEAASCIQYGLCRQCQSGDNNLDVWVQDIMTRKAAALRELKKWVLTPKADTRGQFIARVAASFSQIVSGNWDALEQIEPRKLSHLQLWRTRMGAALGALFMSGLPVLLLWVFQQTSVAFKGVLAEYATLGAYIWAVLTLFMAYDPLFGPKAAALKEVVQSLPVLGPLLGRDKRE